MVGGGAASVVTVTVFDGGETLLAASRATTEKLYAVAGLNPLTVYDVPVGEPTTVPPWRTW